MIKLKEFKSSDRDDSQTYYVDLEEPIFFNRDLNAFIWDKHISVYRINGRLDSKIRYTGEYEDLVEMIKKYWDNDPYDIDKIRSVRR